MPDRMNCPALVQLVTEYLEGAMPDDDKVRFEEHLGRCPPCEVYLVQIRRTIEICGKVELKEIPEDARQSLMAVFEEWKASR